MGRIGLDIYRGNPRIVYAIVEAMGDVRGVYRSSDRGATWEQMSETNPRPMYYSHIRIDPTDPERIYLGGTSFYISSDGGVMRTGSAMPLGSHGEQETKLHA